MGIKTKKHNSTSNTNVNKKKVKGNRIKRETRLRLSLGKGFHTAFDFGKIKNYNKTDKSANTKQINEKFIYIKIKRCLRKYEITEVELKPVHKGTAFKICIKYNINVPKNKTEQVQAVGCNRKQCIKKASIDTGVVNLITMYVPEKRPLIFSGGPIVHINKTFKYKLAKLQSKFKKPNIDPVIKEKLIEKYRKTWIKREHTINDMFHKISTKIIEICKKAKIEELIIGYNVNWKKEYEHGKKTISILHIFHSNGYSINCFIKEKSRIFLLLKITNHTRRNATRLDWTK